jgi:ATP-dependent RNA helicase SUPV3L1/SUV3
MLDAQDKQFQLQEDGEILFQPDATNPLPGKPLAKIKKGAGLLKPAVEVQDSDLLEGKDKAAVAEKVQQWLNAHIATHLETLVALEKEEGIEGTARGISFQLYEALGILPRAQLEDLIKGLDDTGRAALRARKVRLGPVLVFLPTLNKPAAVRLRALLWNLWNDKALPAEVPPNGMTSFVITGKAIDAIYLRAIGYPVYGNRAIRVDMLDRLICEIYDSAKDGTFRAQHKMAEWLGCPIPDLYLVLEAMGHTKIEEKEKPAAAAVEAPVAVVVSSDAAPAETVAVAEAAAEAAPVLETPAAETPNADAPAVPVAAAARPELALFRLRRGKAYGSARPPRPDKKKFDGKKPERKEGERPKGKKPEHKKHDRRDRDNKDRGRDFGDRVAASAAPKELAASPFAMLKNMKVKSGE